jgi:hypothetical protein
LSAPLILTMSPIVIVRHESRSILGSRLSLLFIS